MALEHVTAHNALIDRADRAIADAVATRTCVRDGLIAAGRKCPCRPWVGDVRPSIPLLPPPTLPDGFLEPWWSVARTLLSHREIMQEADAELERLWGRVLPLIETPLALFGSEAP